MQGGDDKGNAKESAAARDNLIYKMQGSDDEEDAKEAAAANHNLIYKSSEVCEARGSTGRREEVRGGEGRQVQPYQKETGIDNNTTFT